MAGNWSGILVVNSIEGCFDPREMMIRLGKDKKDVDRLKKLA